jgi:tetratricopeptide (TPR) repeat protein
MNMGVLLQTLTQADRADDFYRRAQAGHEALAARSPEVTAHRAELAKVLVNRGNLRINEANRRRLRADREAHEPPVLAGRADRAAWAVGQLADRLAALRQLREAEPMIRRGIALNEELVARVPKAPVHRADLGNALNTLAQLGPPDAEAITRRALAIYEGLAADDPKVVDYPKKIGVVSLNLGEILAASGRHDEAESSYLRAVAALEPVQRQEPGDIEAGRYLARTLADQADLRMARRSPSEARPLLERAVGLQRAVVRANAKDSENRTDLYNELGLLARAELALGGHVEAAVIAVEMAPLADGPTRGGLGALAVLARCVALAQSDQSLPTGRRREVARGYVDRAVGVIRGAMAAGPPVVGLDRPGGSLVMAGAGRGR